MGWWKGNEEEHRNPVSYLILRQNHVGLSFFFSIGPKIVGFLLVSHKKNEPPICALVSTHPFGPGQTRVIK